MSSYQNAWRHNNKRQDKNLLIVRKFKYFKLRTKDKAIIQKEIKGRLNPENVLLPFCSKLWKYFLKKTPKLFLCFCWPCILVIFDFMFQLNAPLVYYIYQLPLHVSSHIVLIIRRVHCIHTSSGSLYVTLLRWPFSAQAVIINKWCIKLEHKIKYQNYCFACCWQSPIKPKRRGKNNTENNRNISCESMNGNGVSQCRGRLLVRTKIVVNIHIQLIERNS